jgi:hypothetical protein
MDEAKSSHDQQDQYKFEVHAKVLELTPEDLAAGITLFGAPLPKLSLKMIDVVKEFPSVGVGLLAADDCCHSDHAGYSARAGRQPSADGIGIGHGRWVRLQARGSRPSEVEQRMGISGHVCTAARRRPQQRRPLLTPVAAHGGSEGGKGLGVGADEPTRPRCPTASIERQHRIRCQLPSGTTPRTVAVGAVSQTVSEGRVGGSETRRTEAKHHGK